MEINEIIGNNIQKLRSEQNISITRLAEETGLSKAVISQIERGNANPTINTIWKLAAAFHVPYSVILEKPDVSAEKVAFRDLIPQKDEGGHYRISCYFSGTKDRDFELFLLEFDPGTSHMTNGHTENSEEYLVIKRGKLSLETGNKTFVLEEGDAMMFEASNPHTYKNLSEGITQAVCINYYPKN